MTRRLVALLDGVHVRVAAIIALFIAAAALLFLGVSSAPQHSLKVYLVVRPANLAAIVEALDRVHGQARAELIHGLAASETQIAIRHDFPSDAVRGADPITDRIAEYDRALHGREWRVESLGGTIWPGTKENYAFATAPFRFFVRLNPRDVAMVQRTGPPGMAKFIARFNLLALSGLLLAIAVIALIAREVTRPVRAMAAALRSEQGGLAMDDLPVTGAREFKELAGAFNLMRSTLPDLVDDRTRVLAAIAHDMRTYLTRLELRTDHITDSRQRILAIGDLAEMTAVLNDTLTFAKAVTDKARVTAEAIDIVPVLRSAVEGRSAAGKTVALALDESVPLIVDAGVVAVHRIVVNLIDNAIRYGGNVRVVAAREGRCVMVRVEDDGPGVPESRLEELTKPFFRVEQSRGRKLGGSGLGLAIVDALVREHHGSLTLANRVTGGFSATVLLPVG